VDISVNILRAVDLYDPVDGRKVDTTCTNICAEKYCTFLLDKLEVDGCALVLLHLSMEFKEV
jgi:hypothetical protein